MCWFSWLNQCVLLLKVVFSKSRYGIGVVSVSLGHLLIALKFDRLLLCHWRSRVHRVKVKVNQLQVLVDLALFISFHTILNTLGPRQNGRHFADDVFKCNVLNENVWIPIKISLKFVPDVRNNNIPSAVQMMAWRRTGDKPLFEPMMVSLPTHICVTRPQWINLITTDHFKNLRHDETVTRLSKCLQNVVKIKEIIQFCRPHGRSIQHSTIN